MAKYLDDNGLLYLWQKIKTVLTNKVDAVSGKGLSTNDFTDAEKTKLAGLYPGIESIRVNSGPAITDRTIGLTIPKDTADLTNGAGYQTASDVNSLIATAISDISSISFSVVQSLPQTGEAGVIYLVSHGGSETNNTYDEYIYVNDGFEKLGTTSVDLSGYLQITDKISNADIDTIIAT